MIVMSFEVPIPLLPFLGFGTALALGNQARTTMSEILSVLKFLLVVAVFFVVYRMI